MYDPARLVPLAPAGTADHPACSEFALPDSATQRAIKARPGRTVLVGIGLKIASVSIFLAMSTLMKASAGIPVGELVFFRSLFAIVPIAVFLASRGELRDGFNTRFPLRHLLRGLVGATAMGFGFLALTKLPLPEAVTLNYATPLFVVALSALLLHEPVRLYRWSAVAVGFCGVLVMVGPRLTVFTGGAEIEGDAAIGLGAALLCSAFAAVATLMVRRLVDTERSATIVLYLSVSATLIALVSLPFGWQMPTPQQAVMLLLAGIAGGVGQILVTESYRYADLSVVAPFEYSSLLLSIPVGYLLFGDVPTLPMLAGGLIVIGAGLFIIWRERRLGLDHSESRKLVTPQG